MNPHMQHASPAATERGFALIPIVILMTIVIAFTYIVIDSSLSARKVGKVFQEGLLAEQIAEAGVNQAINCLNATSGTNCGGTFGSSYAGQAAISFGSGSFTTTVTGSGSTRTVTSAGTAPDGSVKSIITDLTTVPPNGAMGFSYALQSGAGGAHMENNSSISGSIYSNGDIDCQSTNAVITGDAYSSKSGGSIDKCKVNYHAHADSITNSKVLGNAYYLTSIAGTTVTGTKYSGQTTPTAAAMPLTYLTDWQTAATNGGTIVGPYHPADNSSLGPIKIDGDLIMDNNVDITVTGTIWVKGNITTGNGNSFTLASGYGDLSGVILADDSANPSTKGKITINNNTTINGSGNAKSHILFVSTNTSTADASPALSVSNNANGAVFYATNGTLRLQSNAGAKSLAGYRLFLDQNAEVTYVSSDFGGNFSNSPGGTWHIAQGTWREK
ncbi:MAG: hypothetical protein RLZZ324_1331 [Candidatus Parcubacteria bacterium]|jgi:hypothetical protein